MKKQPTNTREERKLKLAEAVVMFVLVLGITIFVGARLASRGDETIVADTADTVAEQPLAATAAIDTVPLVTVSVPDPAIEAEVAAPLTGEASLAVDPPRVITYAMAEQAFFDGDYDEAVSRFESYAAEHADNAWGHYMLGLSNWKAGDLDAAGNAFTTALEIKPDHVKSLINYGRVLLEQDRPAAARVQIEAALAQAPENVAANRVYSRICHREGDLEQAATGYLKVLRSAGDDVWSLNNYGLIRIEQGRYAEALPPLAKAAALRPDIACIQNNLGAALERNGHYAAAADAYEMALAADDGYAKADESLDRVSTLTEAPELMPVDLVALAAGFTAESDEAILAAAITEPQSENSELASASTPAGDEEQRRPE